MMDSEVVGVDVRDGCDNSGSNLEITDLSKGMALSPRSQAVGSRLIM